MNEEPSYERLALYPSHLDPKSWGDFSKIGQKNEINPQLYNRYRLLHKVVITNPGTNVHQTIYDSESRFPCKQEYTALYMQLIRSYYSQCPYKIKLLCLQKRQRKKKNN